MANAVNIKFIRCLESNLADIAIADGQIVICKDTGKIYFDFGMERIAGFGNITVDDSRLLPENPTNGDIPCYNATATTGGGNDVNTKVLLHLDDEPFADTAAGNTSPATVTNSGVTLDTENFKFGTASAKFAGGSNNLKVAVPQAQMMASPWLADCWFKVDDGQWSEYSRIFTQDDEQDGGWTYYLMSGNRVGVWVRNVTPNEPASATLTPGDWHYAALVYYNAKFYGFVDGVRFTVQDGSAEGFLNYIMLGKRIQSTSYSLRGNIDEFRFQLLDEAEIGKWTGTTIPVPTAPYSIQETAGEWNKFNKSELALKSELPGVPEWYILADAAAITPNPANGELQKVELTQDCVLTAPTLDADNPTLLLQITSGDAVTVTIGETELVADYTGTFQVGWYWDGTATRRYPVVEVS